MATGDILFLLLFVVLPTAIIVSGIWAVLFVRMRPAVGVRVVEQDETVLEQDSATPALPAAIEETASVAAIAAGPLLPAVPEQATADAVAALPTLSEREAIASINPVAADLLFDQPQPPAVLTPMRDHAPTEEMPAVSKATGPTVAPDAQSEAHVLNEEQEPPAAHDGAEALVEPRHTDELGPEPTESEVLDGQAEDVTPAVDSVGLHDADATAAEDDDTADDVVDGDPEQDSDVDAASIADFVGPQLSKRGPLRLIPADDADPRDRRRARGSGRQVPQLGRSVRRQERRVER